MFKIYSYGLRVTSCGVRGAVDVSRFAHYPLFFRCFRCLRFFRCFSAATACCQGLAHFGIDVVGQYTVRLFAFEQHQGVYGARHQREGFLEGGARGACFAGFYGGIGTGAFVIQVFESCVCRLQRQCPRGGYDGGKVGASLVGIQILQQVGLRARVPTGPLWPRRVRHRV